MKNTLILAALLATSAATFAAAKPGAPDLPTGIVTPDVAVGFRTYADFNNDTAGNMVVRTDGKLWVPVQQVVPAGRTYVGFRVSHMAYGYRVLEVYWK